MTCECYAILIDPKRKALFAGIFPEDKLPITPTEAHGIGWKGWLLDPARLTTEKKGEIFARVAKAKGISLEAIMADWESGIPVREEGAEIHFCGNHLKYGDNAFDIRGFF